MRAVLSKLLQSQPDIEVVGTASNGSIALAKYGRLQPDVVTLDIEMPGMNGLEVLRELRANDPDAKVIMFSAHTRRAASTTLEALARGAADYVTKPNAGQGPGAAADSVREQLVPKLRALALAKSDAGTVPVPRLKSRNEKIELVAIGVSTGGPAALSELFKRLPNTFPVPIAIVQHMPPIFTKSLADRLSSTCPLAFREAQDGDVLEPGTVLIAPGDFHMTLRRRGNTLTARLNQDAPVHSCRPSVDVLFHSVATASGQGSLGVMLTGMGNDGVDGSRAIHSAGGTILAQDKASSVVWSMPGSVVEAGVADGVLPLCQMAAEIERRATRRAEARHAS